MQDIETFNNALIDILSSNSAKCIPTSKHNAHRKPGWTKAVKDLHAVERAMRRRWIREGRPRGMEYASYREYKRAKRAFRNVHDTEYDNFLQSVYREIDEAAELDLRLFWKLVKRRRPRSSRIYPEIRDATGKTHHEPIDIANAFADFYQNIYHPSNNDSFDENFKVITDMEYTRIKTCNDKGDPIHISRNDIITASSSLKRRKAPGADNITNEHVLHSGSLLADCLCKLYNAVINVGCVPSQWKHGLIVPIYKGGSKSKNSCNSYRPVALLPCIFKIFEKVISSKISSLPLNQSFPNVQQQGFQKDLGCLTASFNLQETLYHNLEMGSNVYIGFLDISKAFDTVWRRGFMVKLHNLGIKGQIWKVIDDCHCNTKSAVIVNQTKSRWFPVQQGVRQGGVLSTFLYLVFINNLLEELQLLHSNCPVVLDNNYHSPALADDIACIALSPSALQAMMTTAYKYACKWRFEFNASKSNILSFRAKGQGKPSNADIFLGNCKIQYCQNYDHLGILINCNTKSSSRISNACSKGWKSFYALTDMDISRVNPASMAHLYKTIVLPSILYGCELWNYTNNEDLRRLNTLQHGIIKQILGLPKLTRSDICEQLLDILPISAETPLPGQTLSYEH